MRCWLVLLLILAYMASHSNGASFNQFEHYGSVHGHNHQHDEPFRRQNATKGSLSSLEGDAEGPVLDMVERDPNYPYREVRYFLRNNPLLRDYFVAAATPQIGNRVASPTALDQTGESLCRTRAYKLFYPQRLRNVNNIWRTIVNIENEYEQGVEVKSCARDGMCSRLDSANIPFGFTSYCDQEFISKELMVYNSSTAFDLFRFPSCCVCRIKRASL
ncbi:uncharacterized protein LOC109543936 [Dendroctonus ponderosae]|uniref:uncharacterized protein LOC109543936 n=1 Tax=Dendroctonus ponderosae TaxID=77166 RepID=UPI002035255B|nr:uncharacterized protein LOC109543936 [Dendroctonus ponderosae]